MRRLDHQPSDIGAAWMTHPLSQAEADRVKQRSYRMGRKASESIEAWFSPLGCIEDILDYERAAEAQQLLVGKIAGTEAIVKGIIGQ